MGKKPHITLILGTARQGRQSEKVAKYMMKKLKKFEEDMDVNFVDVRDYIYPETIAPWMEDERTNPWRDVVEKTDGFIIVTPEYNHGYPGELKLLLDQELKKYIGKPVGFCGVSSGVLGGARVIEALLPVMRELGLQPLSYDLRFGQVKDLFEKSEEELDKEYIERIDKFVRLLLDAVKR